MSIQKSEWYELKIKEVEAKFALLLARVKDAEDRLDKIDKKNDMGGI